MPVTRLAATLILAIVTGLAVGLSSAAADDSAAPALAVERVSSGIYIHEGMQADANRDNGGDIANIGFIVGTRCVAVVDTGGTPRIGRQLYAAVRGVTDRPVCYVINTHMHPDHVLGNRAFVGNDPTFIAAAGFERALASRASAYLAALPDTVGQPGSDSWIVEPDRQIDDETTLDLGDRRLVLKAWPRAHTDNDLTVFDEKTSTLWLGDLLFVNRIPSVDGSVPGWVDVLDRLAARDDVETAIPGHGPVQKNWKAALSDERRYLVTVRDAVRDAIDDGYDLNYATRHAAQSERSNWLLFDHYNARNVTAAYTELEWQ